MVVHLQADYKISFTFNKINYFNCLLHNGTGIIKLIEAACVGTI